jgi:hypothetical protein
MAELVDALVSNTCVFTDMPVRLRLWVLKAFLFIERLFCYKHLHTVRPESFRDRFGTEAISYFSKDHLIIFHSQQISCNLINIILKLIPVY